jgi:hypothetical protein
VSAAKIPHSVLFGKGGGFVHNPADQSGRNFVKTATSVRNMLPKSSTGYMKFRKGSVNKTGLGMMRKTTISGGLGFSNADIRSMNID